MIISYLLVVGDIPFALSRSRPEVVRTLPTATRAWSIQCVIQSHCFQIGNLVSCNSCSIIFQGSLMIWLLMESAETSAKRIGAQKSEIHFETHRRWSWIHHINYFPHATPIHAASWGRASWRPFNFVFASERGLWLMLGRHVGLSCSLIGGLVADRRLAPLETIREATFRLPMRPLF